jgi:hypothetical protein
MSINKTFNETPSYQFTSELLKSQVLGKIKLCGIPIEAAEKRTFHELCDILNSYETEQIEVSRSIIKTYQESLPRNISTNPPQATINRLHEQVKLGASYKAAVLEDIAYENAIKAEADKYNIFYDKTTSLFALEDAVNEWKSMLKTAEEQGIKWLENNYDPIGLQQEIDETGHRASKEQQSLHHYYYATR